MSSTRILPDQYEKAASVSEAVTRHFFDEVTVPAELWFLIAVCSQESYRSLFCLSKSISQCFDQQWNYFIQKRFTRYPQLQLNESYSGFYGRIVRDLNLPPLIGANNAVYSFEDKEHTDEYREMLIAIGNDKYEKMLHSAIVLNLEILVKYLIENKREEFQILSKRFISTYHLRSMISRADIFQLLFDSLERLSVELASTFKKKFAESLSYVSGEPVRYKPSAIFGAVGEYLKEFTAYSSFKSQKELEGLLSLVGALTDIQGIVLTGSAEEPSFIKSAILFMCFKESRLDKSMEANAFSLLLQGLSERERSLFAKNILANIFAMLHNDSSDFIAQLGLSKNLYDKFLLDRHNNFKNKLRKIFYNGRKDRKSLSYYSSYFDFIGKALFVCMLSLEKSEFFEIIKRQLFLPGFDECIQTCLILAVASNQEAEKVIYLIKLLPESMRGNAIAELLLGLESDIICGLVNIQNLLYFLKNHNDLYDLVLEKLVDELLDVRGRSVNIIEVFPDKIIKIKSLIKSRFSSTNGSLYLNGMSLKLRGTPLKRYVLAEIINEIIMGKHPISMNGLFLAIRNSSYEYQYVALGVSIIRAAFTQLKKDVITTLNIISSNNEKWELIPLLIKYDETYSTSIASEYFLGCLEYKDIVNFFIKVSDKNFPHKFVWSIVYEKVDKKELMIAVMDAIMGMGNNLDNNKFKWHEKFWVRLSYSDQIDSVFLFITRKPDQPSARTIKSILSSVKTAMELDDKLINDVFRKFEKVENVISSVRALSASEEQEKVVEAVVKQPVIKQKELVEEDAPRSVAQSKRLFEEKPSAMGMFGCFSLPIVIDISKEFTRNLELYINDHLFFSNKHAPVAGLIVSYLQAVEEKSSNNDLKVRITRIAFYALEDYLSSRDSKKLRQHIDALKASYPSSFGESAAFRQEQAKEIKELLTEFKNYDEKNKNQVIESLLTTQGLSTQYKQ